MKHEYGKIGPNAIIQTVQALKEAQGTTQAARTLQKTPYAYFFDEPPDEMIAEQTFYALVHELAGMLSDHEMHSIMRRSGQLTAFYLLKHRIPQPAQHILRIAPRRIALWLLLSAVKKNSWTFVGSGQYRFTLGSPPMISIIHAHASSVGLTEPVWHFYSGCFEQLLRSLINRTTQVQLHIQQYDQSYAGHYAIAY
ncbi:MAG: bacteriochlorophyll 4-vinyl reductase [Chloroflexi bacterium AL-W]|nr:bacteriochlorophyll 4-vinyl reductase [Chloroflexi bacterium AL-N1]NOK66888.1 bacteriochlorophyll 4-vinyl reductase [Chloroflexi bacterium AL-N10]NOK74820.1 bacteriochlorophyll 4-vinyl reductase [Chloroflexi bacterium AL-N5]NOK81490.1 bacteriochlorophyll 4-vinyl reductase [Chloroflexi bacterium AL-W]NOK88960.1 bacteriochlorophyll 4-vinyl reductase [Chloroflexi bacterium AL-N15]